MAKDQFRALLGQEVLGLPAPQPCPDPEQAKQADTPRPSRAAPSFLGARGQRAAGPLFPASGHTNRPARGAGECRGQACGPVLERALLLLRHLWT